MTMKTMGETISTLRKERAMTQAELAARMNVTDKAVSKWERDLSCPDISSIPRLAEVLGISVEQLLRAEPQAKSGPRPEEIVGLVLRTIPLAMGVAVVALSAIGQMGTQAAVTMLGLGLACVGVTLLQKEEK